MTLTESQRRGLITTAIFHAGILLLLLMFGFSVPFPPPAEQGILLDFGNSETGLGLEEPSAGRIEVLKEESPEPAAAVKPVKSKAPVQEDEEILTQDYEKTVAIKAPPKKKIDKEKKIKQEEDKKLREELEKQQQLERLEKQRIAEAEKVKKEEAAKSLAINARAKNAFGTGKTDNGSQSRGQGVTYGSGNQGSPNGAPGANQFGSGGGSGNGRGNGTSFTLSGRSALSLPKPNFPGNEAGTVVVEVTVDKFGKVTKAMPGTKGSNTIDPDLLEAARKAALSAVFNTDQNAPAFQKGTITYHFRLQ
jgi:outer membrane biosynthesis protein TonB